MVFRLPKMWSQRCPKNVKKWSSPKTPSQSPWRSSKWLGAEINKNPVFDHFLVFYWKTVKNPLFCHFSGFAKTVKTDRKRGWVWPKVVKTDRIISQKPLIFSQNQCPKPYKMPIGLAKTGQNEQNMAKITKIIDLFGLESWARHGCPGKIVKTPLFGQNCQKHHFLVKTCQ